MQLKIIFGLITLVCLLGPLKGKTLPRKGCYECQEEVWEEVLCGSMPNNKSTVTPTTTTTTTAAPPPTRRTTKQPSPATTSAPATRPSAKKIPETNMPTDPYKKCYNDCKSGCKEFCHKVVENPSQKQIVQVSKITEPAAKGRVKLTHVLQREFISQEDEPYNNINGDYEPLYAPYAPSENAESEQENYKLPLSVESSYEEESEVKPEPYPVANYENAYNPLKTYFSKEMAPQIESVYSPHAIAEIDGYKEIPPLDPYSVESEQPAYSGPPYANADYGLPMPFENLYSKITKSLNNPENDAQIQIDDASEETSQPHAQYDDSFHSLLENVRQSDPSHKTDHYPLPYNSL